MDKSISISIRAQYLLSDRKIETPAVLLLGFHGYAETAKMQMERLEALELPENILLCAPEAYNRLYSRAGNVISSWMTKAYRQEAIEDCIQYIDSLVSSLQSEYHCDVSPILFGFSQGAALAYRYAIKGKYQSRALIAVGSDIPPEVTDSLRLLPKTLVCFGDSDERVSPSVIAESISLLDNSSAPYQLVSYEGGHSPTEKCLNEISDFIKNLIAAEKK